MNSSLYIVAGLGKTGLSIARYLQRTHKNFIAFDTRTDSLIIEEFSKEFPDISIYTQAVPCQIMDQVTDIIASPGLSLDSDFIVQAKQKRISVYGDIECFAREVSAPVIAITGTNGKSTVTTLVGDMARAAGLSVAVAGNIGIPVLDMLVAPYQFDLWVLELSSFQLDLTESLKPIAATILNVTPDHLDRHHSLDIYIQAKQRIYQHAKIALYNRDDPHTVPAIEVAAISFGMNVPDENNWGLQTQGDKVYLAKGSSCFLTVESVLIKGMHNWLNALAACALAQAAGISDSIIKSVLTEFPGLPHRSQWVRTLNDVDWINDSKGTNVGATISAINGIGGSMQGKIVLIAGGQGKDANFDQLAHPIADYVRSVVLIGEDADKIEASLAKIAPIVHASSLDRAVELAKIHAKPGDVVLLSPACASLDMFRDFNHRGETFVSLVNRL